MDTVEKKIIGLMVESEVLIQTLDIVTEMLDDVNEELDEVINNE